MAQLRPTPLLTPKHHIQREWGDVQEREEKNKDTECPTVLLTTSDPSV